MKPGSSRRDFIRRALFGGGIAGLLSRAAPTSAETESRSVDRRKLGRVGADVSILGLGLARKTHKKASKAAPFFCKFLVLNKLNFTKRTPLR